MNLGMNIAGIGAGAGPGAGPGKIGKNGWKAAQGCIGGIVGGGGVVGLGMVMRMPLRCVYLRGNFKVSGFRLAMKFTPWIGVPASMMTSRLAAKPTIVPVVFTTVEPASVV